jgi:hypothetical protein
MTIAKGTGQTDISQGIGEIAAGIAKEAEIRGATARREIAECVRPAEVVWGGGWTEVQRYAEGFVGGWERSKAELRAMHPSSPEFAAKVREVEDKVLNNVDILRRLERKLYCNFILIWSAALEAQLDMHTQVAAQLKEKQRVWNTLGTSASRVPPDSSNNFRAQLSVRRRTTSLTRLGAGGNQPQSPQTPQSPGPQRPDVGAPLHYNMAAQGPAPPGAFAAQWNMAAMQQQAQQQHQQQHLQQQQQQQQQQQHIQQQQQQQQWAAQQAQWNAAAAQRGQQQFGGQSPPGPSVAPATTKQWREEVISQYEKVPNVQATGGGDGAPGGKPGLFRGPPPTPPAAAAAAPAATGAAATTPGSQRARAKFAYTAVRADEHSFPKDAMMVIVKQDAPHWWTASIDGRTALVPSNYLEIVD